MQTLPSSNISFYIKTIDNFSLNHHAVGILTIDLGKTTPPSEMEVCIIDKNKVILQWI